ncbi:MAG: beta-ketoacyl synthase N-terminal-like domain-containing protein [Gemmataceae bacterium]
MQPPREAAAVPNLVDLLRARVGEPGDLGFRYLASRDGSVQAALTFADLDRRARAVAAALAERNLHGERALLCYPPGLEFMVGLYGALYAGLVAVPAYPPRAHKPDARLGSMTVGCRPAVVLTSAELVADRQRLTAQMPELAAVPWVASDAVENGLAAEWKPVHPSPDDLAILQYTSGSTGDPKGVMLTHSCVLHNIAGISRAMGLVRGSVGVSWLPAFHDMGLIGNLLGVIWYPGCLNVLSPLAMLQDPFRWLDAVSRTRAYISGGPCFAFEQATKRVTPEQRKQLDLSAWRVAYCGAEPISPRVLDEFARAFAECGFRRESFYPCFGLAEASLMVTGVEAGAGPVVRVFSGASLERDRAEPAEKGRALVGSGAPIRDLDVLVVDPQSRRPLANGSIGEVWVRGPSVAAGYFERPDATEATFGGTLSSVGQAASLPNSTEGQAGSLPYDGWLRTGDLGFFHDGELFIAGRLKDVLILRGRNYYPQDIEEAVQVASPLLKSGGGAAFTDEDDYGARLVLVYEVQRGYKPGGDKEVHLKARAAIAEEFGVELSELVLIRAGTLPRTSSGKVARRETRQRFLAGELDVVERFVGAATVREREALQPPPDGRGSDVRTWLVDRLARQVGVSRSEIDVEKPFASYGLDSLAMVQIAGELERWLGRPLSPTLLYSAPTVSALAKALSAPESRGGESATPLDARIAIVGIGCRFPGAEGPEEFWKLLREGRSAIRDLPEGRWSADGRALTTTRGGYLDDVRGFDAAFFGLSPREAPWIDPQHRLLLETAYHSLEDAGLAVDRLAGSRTGVFVGISSNDYGRLLSDHAAAEMYLATGNAASMAAHRLSYHLDLHGPSLSIDTACSSSLTATHYACQALRNGECDLALAAGVNLILTPEITEALSKAQMLSPSARCKTFDATADGYVRGEGVGVVVLKPLAAALKDGDPVYAVIEATAVNQDGRSNGITAPNGQAQVALLRGALARAGRRPEDVTCVETHGTGTALGDPIEFDALREALGQAGTPCALGAVKSNVGHLEAAAGIAGLIKSALQVSHAEVVPVVGLGEVNPLIRLEGSRFRIPRSSEPWAPQLVGVSSFGFGGSNAHALLSAGEPGANAPGGLVASPPVAYAPRTPLVVPHYAPTQPAHPDQTGRLAAHLRSHDLPLADVAHTLANGRCHLPHRLSVLASDAADLAAALEQWHKTGRDPRVQAGKAFGEFAGRVAFLFTGQGSTKAGLAKAFDGHDVFRAALDRCEAAVKALAGWSVREVLDDPARIDETEFGQPALFALEYALAELWKSWGVVPAAVLGHSVGEYAAACAAGVFSPEDGLRLLVERGRGMQACPPGAMLACLAAFEQVRPTAERYGDRVSLAASNGPRQCVLSGDAGALAAVAMELTELRIDSKVLPVRRAFHSALIEPALERLRQAARQVKHAKPTIPLVSNLTGGTLDAAPDAAYWAEHARRAVRFEAGVQALHRLGVTHFVEVGPAAVLSRLGETCLPGSEAAWLSTMREGRPGEMLRSAGRLHADGLNLNWSLLATGRRVRLPGYPFQHRDYWLDDLPRVARSVDRNEAPAPEPVIAWKPRSCWAQALPRLTPNFDRLPTLVQGAVDAAWSEHPLADAVRLRPEFDRLAGLYIATTLSRLGWRPLPGERLTLTELAGRLGVVPHKGRLLRRLAQLAAEDGWLELSGDDVTVRALPPADDAYRTHIDLRERFPDFEVELRLAHHCARHLGDVLQGKVDPLQILFDGEAAQLTAEIYSRAPVARFYNALLTRAVTGLLRSLPAGRPVRVLEVGAGTGGTTQALLPTLPAGRTEYAFTDVSSLFLARARDRFARYDALDFRTLDLEADPAPQGFADGQFDLVVASNVLHATADLRLAVKNAARLLTPGGVMVLLEGTGPRRLLDLIFGLTEGWWKFLDDGVRPDYPLIAPAAWRRLLLEEGFDTIVALPENDGRLPDPDQVVLLARRAVTGPTVREGVPSPAFRVVGDGPLREAMAECLALADDAPRVVLLPGSSRSQLAGPLEQLWQVTVGEWPGVEPGVTRIDLDPAQSVEAQAAALAEALLRPDREPVVAYRGDQRYVPLSAPVEEAAERQLPEVVAPDRAALVAASPFERRAAVESYLRQELARLLGAPVSQDDMEMPVQSLGLDSLMAIQVRNRVETSLGVSLSLVDFLKGMRVRQLVDGIVEQLAAAAPPVADEGKERRAGPVAVATEGVGQLSESELDSLLVTLLDNPTQDAP